MLVLATPIAQNNEEQPHVSTTNAVRPILLLGGPETPTLPDPDATTYIAPHSPHRTRRRDAFATPCARDGRHGLSFAYAKDSTVTPEAIEQQPRAVPPADA